MTDDLGLDVQGMASGDPGAAGALELGAQTVPKELIKVANDEDFLKVPHGSAFLDPEGKTRYKPIRNDADFMALPEGAKFADPSGQIRTKPKYEGIDFTPQTLYDIAHSDKGRKMALEKFYPGKVREDPSGGFYIEDEGGKFRKPGRGLSAVTGTIASETIPTVLAGAGSLLGGAAGTAIEPGGGTVLGGAAGGYGGGYAGQRINDIFSQLAGVYDPEGGEANARMAGYAGAAGDIGGRAVAAAAPAFKEGAKAIGRGAAKTTAKFLGAGLEDVETGLGVAAPGETPGKFGMTKPGTAVSPSAMFKSAPHVGNVAETLQQKFDATDTYLANAERFMDKRAKDILASKEIGLGLGRETAGIDPTVAGVAKSDFAKFGADISGRNAQLRIENIRSGFGEEQARLYEQELNRLGGAKTKDIGSIVEDSLVHPKAAVSTEKAGILLRESHQAKTLQESVMADQHLQEELELRRSAVSQKTPPSTLPNEFREQARTATENKDYRLASELTDKELQQALPEAKRNGMRYELPMTGGEGSVEFSVTPTHVQVGHSYLDSNLHNQGIGISTYKRLADWALASGREFVSDSSVSTQAARVYAALERRGYQVERHAQSETSHLGGASAPGRPAFRVTAGPSRIEKARLEQDALVRAATRAREAADNLVQEGFRDIERQAADAIRVAQVGHNAGDLWRTVAESFVAMRRSLGRRAEQMYGDAHTASNGLVPPGAEGLAPRAQALLDQLPEGFAASHPTIVRRIAAMAGEVGENGEVIREPISAAWTELHELRTMIRQDIKWNDLTSDVKNGALKHMQNGIDEVLHSVENQPALREASKLLTLADDFYREHIGPFNNQQIKTLVKALNSGLQADPKALLKIAVQDGKSEVANTIRNTVGPQTWDAVRAADVQEMMAQSRQLDGSIDGLKFANMVEDRAQNGLLEVLHGDQGGARLRQQALYIKQLRGKLPIAPRPGDTANDIILRARSAAADAEAKAASDPLKLLQNEMKKVESAVKKEMVANKKPDPLAFLSESTVGANKAVDKILGDPDLIVAASRAFPGGEKSPEFQLMRQIWTQRFLSETLEPGAKLAATSEEIQKLMFPGITLDDMHLLAKEMKLLMSGKMLRGGGEDMGGSMMAQSAVENPFGRASGLGKLAGPAKLIPGANMGARAALTAYYNGVRALLTSPSTLRWLRKGLTSRDPQAKEAARAELRAALQRGGAMGASAGEAVEQEPE